MQLGFDKKYCDEFQNSLNYEKIDRIWKSFREAGNSLEGKITRANFKKVLTRFNIKNDKFMDGIFQRFKLDKYYETKTDRQQIDLQDLVIGLAILSRIVFQQKVRYIFYLTDLDQDGCLSLEEIQNMIERVEKIFCKENSSAKVASHSLLFDMAHRKAQRNYKELIFLLKKNNSALKNDESSLITCEEFMEALSQSRDLFLQQKLLPLNLSLSEVLQNVASEPLIKISEMSRGQFCDFRKQIYQILNQKGQNNNGNLVKYPGRIEIHRNQKHIQFLPAVEKIAQKKSQKPNIKSKANNNNIKIVQSKDIYDQKAAEQTLQSYKIKVKKMIQTKLDPRLNEKLDKIISK